MKYLQLIFLVGSVLLLAGCKHILPPETSLVDTGEVAAETDTGQDLQEDDTEPQAGSWIEVADTDSPWSGSFTTEVMVKKYVELDPWLYAGEEDDGEQIRTDCLEKVAAGIESAECPTNTILRIERTDGQEFPKEINWSSYNQIQDIPQLTIGCLGDNGWYLAPIWNFRDDLENIISSADQQTFLDAIEQETPLTVRITKKAYDIPGRGGTACDNFFASIEAL